MWAAHYIDGESVSREQFFLRTTPTERLTLDKWQTTDGAPPFYASAEEWQADMEAVMLENSVLGDDEVRQLVAAEACMWAESEHGRAAGVTPT